MMFVELHELRYHNGGYYTEPLLCNIDEISNVFESESRYVDARIIVMKNKKIYRVQDSYDEIVKKICG